MDPPPPPPPRWMLCPPPVSIATTRPAVASTITSARTGTTHTGRFDSPSTNPVRFVVELPAHASFDEAWGPSAKLPRRVRVRSASRAAADGADRAEEGALEEATTLSFISVTGRCISRSTVWSA